MTPEHEDRRCPHPGGETPASAEAEAWLAAIIESTSDAVIGVDLDGAVISANDAARHLFGYSRTEFVGLPLSDLAVPERVVVLPAILDRLRHGEAIENYRVELRRRNGERFPVAITASPVVSRGGQIIGASGIIRDLSDDENEDPRRRLLDSLVQSSSDAIFSRTLEGTITSWNPAAERLFGYTEEEIVGAEPRMLVPPEGVDEFDETTEKIVRGERMSDLDTIRWTKDRRRIPVSLQLFPIRDDTGAVSGVGCMARDLLRTAEKEKDFLKLERLSEREREVLGLLSDGLTNKEIADTFGLSEQTVKNYVSRILLKLGVESRTEAAARFLWFRSFLGPSAC